MTLVRKRWDGYEPIVMPNGSLSEFILLTPRVFISYSISLRHARIHFHTIQPTKKYLYIKSYICKLQGIT